jgi:hypothetical protein
MSVLPNVVNRSPLGRLWDTVSDLLIATAVIWVLPLCVGIVAAIVTLLVNRLS